MEGTAKKRRICENDGMARGASCSHPSTEGDGTAILSGYDYEVFLSFRGLDTRAGFTDFLYHSLKDAGIRAFKDDEDLRIGEEFAPEFLQAIKRSKISIPIFSKDYASSVWCLKEVAQMVECRKTGGQKIMPIFYDVAPSEVRYQTKGYARAFLSLENKDSHENREPHENKKRYDQKTIGEWKAALKEVSFLNAWNLHNKPNRKEAEFAKGVTQEVFNELTKGYLLESDNLVSVDHHVDEIMAMIGAQKRETQIIGIHGMGGVGKTTIAKMIYNRLSNNFMGCCCFISNIREVSKRNGIECLQNQLIHAILGTNWKDIKNIDEGIEIIENRLPSKKVLLLLDDVDHKDHMDALVGKRNWFGKGSKLIITSRNKEVFNVPKVDNCYEVNTMDKPLSLQLFSKHAFRRDKPLHEYIDRSMKVIEIAGGLPLALKTIGSLLSGKNMTEWDDTLEELATIPPTDVQSKLKISYKALNDRQKRIFCDIACLFIGYDKDVLLHFWHAPQLFPKKALEVLQNRSLIKISEDKKVWMHDILRDLGREMVRQESKRKVEEQSSVWNPKEALDLLVSHEGKKVEALRLQFDREQQCSFIYEDFKSLSNLRFLEVGGSMENFRAEDRLLWHESPSNVPPTNDFQKNSDLLPRLQWLSWHKIPPIFNITNFSMKKVVIVDLSESEVTHTWKGWSHMEVMENLKVLNLANCYRLEKTPNLSAHAKLERLVLRGCSELVEIDGSICQLKKLVSLDISECRKLQRLPEELGGLEALEELRINWTLIKKIPNCQGMRKLRIFDASSCQHFTLYSTIRDLVSLEYLFLRASKSVKVLPDSIKNLKSLIKLDISYTGIRKLPDYIGDLENLKVVKMTCDFTSKIPDSLWTIEKLEEIEAKMHPGSIGDFHVKIGNCIYRNQSLRILRLGRAKIDAVPRLPESLVILELTTLYMKTIPDLSNLTNLKELTLWFGPRESDGESDGPMEEGPMPWCVGNLSKLETLYLTYVTNLPTDISLLTRLKHLSIHCRNLHCLPRLPSNLLSLGLTPCKSFCSMDLSYLKKLSSLRISGCAFSEIQSLDCLENLQVLQLWDLQQVKILPDLSNFNKLSDLEVQNCGNLVEIQGKLPQSLKELEIQYCGSLQKLPNLSSLKGLQSFSLHKCGNLDEIQDELPESLEILWISSCRSLRQLPDLSNLKGLQRFYMSKCKNLVEIQGELSSLRELEIYSCGSLRQLPNLSSLKGLREVKIKGCGKLNVEAISRLCSEKKVKFMEEFHEWDEDDDESESEQTEQEDDEFEHGSEREDDEWEGEDDESKSEREDDEFEYGSEGEDNESEGEDDG